jgi:hypothetical protein
VVAAMPALILVTAVADTFAAVADVGAPPLEVLMLLLHVLDSAYRSRFQQAPKCSLQQRLLTVHLLLLLCFY